MSNDQNQSQEYLQGFHNFLKKRVSLLTKPYNPIVPIKKSRRTIPNELKLRVIQSERFNRYVDKISTNKNDRQKKVFEALQILSEIAFDRKLIVIRTLGTVIDNIMAKLYTGVHINERSIERLKASMGNQQIIYLPTHRSYVDFMLMSYICFNYNIEIPAIAAGMDFHSMLGLGELLRKTGAFFMRRTFGDEFYWNIFSEYMHEIITHNDFGLEFFIEGTRSRTCKALWPKTGLLTMALTPYFMGEVYDIKIVPTAISYEKVLEEQLFVYELLGIPKPKESTSGFFKGVKSVLDKSYGNMYFDFCEPVSLNQYFGSKVDKFKYASEPAHVQKLSSDEIQLTSDFSHHVVREQQKKIIITLYNIIALSYNHRVFKSQELTMADLQKDIRNMVELFENLGAIVAVDFKNLVENINETIAIHENILEISGGNSKLRLKKQNTIIGKRVEGIKLKGHWICKEVMDKIVPIFSLQLYCNPTLFWLSQPAIFVLSLLDRQNMTIEELKTDVSLLRNVFIYEFVLYPRFADDDFDRTLEILLKLQVIRKISDFICLNDQSQYIDIFLSAISPFLNCYFHASSIISSNFNSKQFTDKEAFIAIQSFLEDEILKGNHNIHPYSLCLESITTTILSLCNNGCLFKEKQNSVNHYTVHSQNLSSLIEQLKAFNSKLNFVYKYFSSLLPSKM